MQLRTLRATILGATMAGTLAMTAVGAASQEGPGINETCGKDQTVLFDGEDNGQIQAGALKEGATFTDGDVTVTIETVTLDEEQEVDAFTYTVDGTTIETVLVKAGPETHEAGGRTIDPDKAVSHVTFCAPGDEAPARVESPEESQPPEESQSPEESESPEESQSLAEDVSPTPTPTTSETDQTPPDETDVADDVVTAPEDEDADEGGTTPDDTSTDQPDDTTEESDDTAVLGNALTAPDDTAPQGDLDAVRAADELPRTGAGDTALLLVAVALLAAGAAVLRATRTTVSVER